MPARFCASHAHPAPTRQLLIQVANSVALLQQLLLQRLDAQPVAVLLLTVRLIITSHAHAHSHGAGVCVTVQQTALLLAGQDARHRLQLLVQVQDFEFAVLAISDGDDTDAGVLGAVACGKLLVEALQLLGQLVLLIARVR